MPKFFISSSEYPQSFDISDTIVIKGDDAHHISKTLRMKVGDVLTVTNSESIDYTCVIDAFSADTVSLKITDIAHSETESNIKVSLFQALVKGDKMETVIQKAVELGVFEIFPVVADRSVVKLDSSSEKKKVERWNKIALEAAKQCGRGIVPVVHSVIDFKECVERLTTTDVGFFCYELSDGRTPKDLLKEKNYSSLGFYIGPEGGISPAEAELAIQKGIEPVTLGKLILRTETAGPAVMSMILYETQL